MTQDPELPDWAAPLNLRRMLWQEFGVASDELSLKDVLRAARLCRAEREREANIVRRANGNL
jgi:hypothetical protein